MIIPHNPEQSRTTHNPTYRSMFRAEYTLCVTVNPRRVPRLCLNPISTTLDTNKSLN